jgi:hypothetical protein
MNTLKHCGILLLISFQSQLNAQINWTEDFNDNNLQSPIFWQGDTQSFITNSNLQLQLNGSSSSSPSFLGCSSKVIDQATWEFYIKLDFSPSSSNFAEVYVVADQLDPMAVSEAYFLRIGGISGSADDVSLYVKHGSQETELIDGIDGLAGGSSVEMMIKVEKDSKHLWSLWIDESLSGNYQLQGNAYDSSIQESSYFMLWAKYTSTRADKFFWDSISVSGYSFLDQQPIELRELAVLDSNTLQILLSEIPEINTALDPGNYRIVETGLRPNQLRIDPIDSTKLTLSFPSVFESGRAYNLEVKNLSDRSANQMQTDSLSFVYYKIERALFSDLRITEIMADPSPAIGLPEVEYLELFNTSEAYFNLEKYSIADPSSNAELPSYIIEPGNYVLLCRLEDTVSLSAYGPLIGLVNFPSLNNSEDHLWLRDSSGNLIDQLNYRASWHENEMKRNGGWSLEMVNPFLKCSGRENFTSSNDILGGSPARQNSVFHDEVDTLPPIIEAIELKSASQIQLWFNEIIDTSLLVELKILFQGEEVGEMYSIHDDGRGLLFEPKQPLDSGVWYRLKCINLYDCEGNKADTLSGQLLLPFIPQTQEIILNEILFNPKSGSIDFVELMNVSKKTFNLSGLGIGNAIDSTSREYLDIETRLIKPDELVVISEDYHNLKAFHTSLLRERHLEADLPTFPNEQGTFYLFNQKNQLIERFYYHEEMHFQLLSTYDGVSLERLDPRGQSDPKNFFSASAAENYATPGLENSQKLPTSSRASIGLREKIFSPDNDGFQDLLFLDYQFEKSGFVGTVEILDAQGRSVIKLINNQLLGIEGSFRWDGIDYRGSRVPLGIYILTFEAFHPSGDLVFKKLPLVVARMLD